MDFFSRFLKDSIIIKILIVITAFLFSLLSEAQVAIDTEVYRTLKTYDEIIFEEAFNKCNIEKMEPLIHNDLEFYHDVAGVTDKSEFLKAVQQNICSNLKVKPIRKLTDGTLEVYPLKNNGILYGAIQKGKHEFFLRENGKLRPTGNALFTHVWILDHNKWKLKRVLSYHHQPVN